jgi:hypothetical protein
VRLELVVDEALRAVAARHQFGEHEQLAEVVLLAEDHRCVHAGVEPADELQSGVELERLLGDVDVAG